MVVSVMIVLCLLLWQWTGFTNNTLKKSREQYWLARWLGAYLLSLGSSVEAGSVVGILEMTRERRRGHPCRASTSLDIFGDKDFINLMSTYTCLSWPRLPSATWPLDNSIYLIRHEALEPTLTSLRTEPVGAQQEPMLCFCPKIIVKTFDSLAFQISFCDVVGVLCLWSWHLSMRLSSGQWWSSSISNEIVYKKLCNVMVNLEILHPESIGRSNRSVCWNTCWENSQTYLYNTSILVDYL